MNSQKILNSLRIVSRICYHLLFFAGAAEIIGVVFFDRVVSQESLTVGFGMLLMYIGSYELKELKA